jgi:hypothetical protein
MVMSTTKVWYLIKPDFSSDDLEFINRLNCKIEITEDIMDVVDAYGRVWQYKNGHTTVEVSATCDKQESMLQLKYAEYLKLKSTIYYG